MQQFCLFYVNYQASNQILFGGLIAFFRNDTKPLIQQRRRRNRKNLSLFYFLYQFTFRLTNKKKGRLNRKNYVKKDN